MRHSLIGRFNFRFLLFIPILCSSAYLFPMTSPIALPAYLVSLLGFYIKPRYSIPGFKITLLLSLFLSFLSLASVLYNGIGLFGTNVTQTLFYISLFLIIPIGYSYLGISDNALLILKRLVLIFILTNVYGVYTYYAQNFDLIEPFWFLRPNPALQHVGDLNKVFVQGYSGWNSPYRAYSIWFEPSYASMVLACTLPLLFLDIGNRLKVIFILSTIGFSYLTGSRSTWLITCLGLLCILLGPRLNARFYSKLGVIFFPFFLGILSITALMILSLSQIDESAVIRVNTTLIGLSEFISAPIFGVGQIYLVEPFIIAGGETGHIHNSVLSIVHWLGIMGFGFFILLLSYMVSNNPFVNYQARASIFLFSMLSFLAICIGGDLMSFPLYWFSYGLYLRMSRSNTYQ